MQALGYRDYCFPPAIIQHAVWLYLRFTLSFRDVEGLLAERGIIVSYETIRRWVDQFGPIYARCFRVMRPAPTGRWHLDEVFVSIAGQQVYLWRAVDDEGEVLDILVQARCDKNAAQHLKRKLLKNQKLVPTSIVTDYYRVYDAALRGFGLSRIHRRGRQLNNRAESSHVPIRRRERKMQGFRSAGSAQRFLSSYSASYNTFNVCRHLTTASIHRILRSQTFHAWNTAVVASACNRKLVNCSTLTCQRDNPVEVTHRTKGRLFGLEGLAPLRHQIAPPRRPEPGRGRGRPPIQDVAAETTSPPPLPPLGPIERRNLD